MQVYIAIFIFFINILLWFWFFIAFTKKYAPERVLERIRIEVNKLITSINNETDRDVNLIESRIKGLKTLIQEADKRINISETEIKKRETSSKVLESLTTPKTEISKNAIQQKLSVYETNKVNSSGSLDKDELVITQNPLPINNSQQAEILRLAELGFEENEIATELKLPVGEVSFIINLSKM
ncbi:MAG: DUF6115 domain-containing protein [Treponemataceae bacterium]